MIRTAKKILAAGAVLAVTSAAAQALTVKFDQPNMGLGSGPIVVESADGKTWSKINSSNLRLPFAVFIGHNSDDYEYRSFTILQGNREVFQSLENVRGYNPYIFSSQADGSTDNFDSIAKTLVRETCNKRLETAGAIHEDQHMFFDVPLSMVALFQRDNGSYFTKTAYGHVKVEGVCKGIPKRVPPKPLRITRVSFQAYAADDVRCPRQRTVRVKLEGDRVGKVDVVVMRDDGKKIEKTVPVGKHGEGEYFRLESAMIMKSETRKYYLTLKGHNISVGWKKVAIKCSIEEDDRPDEVAGEQKPNMGDAKPGGKIVGKRPAAPTIVINPVKPRRPATTTVDLTTPALRCIGGKVKLNNCYCKSGYKKLKVAKHTYRCIKQTTNKAPKRSKPNKRKTLKAVPQQKRKRTGPLQKLLKAKR